MHHILSNMYAFCFYHNSAENKDIRCEFTTYGWYCWRETINVGIKKKFTERGSVLPGFLPQPENTAVSLLYR